MTDFFIYKEIRTVRKRTQIVTHCPYCFNFCALDLGQIKATHIKSCGCLKLKHGLSQVWQYKIASHIFDRCYNPKNSNYKNQGAKGIAVDFETKVELIHYLIELAPIKKDNFQFERIDKNGNYVRGNIRYAVNEKNALNNPKKHKLTTSLRAQFFGV